MRDLLHGLEWHAYCVSERLSREVDNLSQSHAICRLAAAAISLPFVPFVQIATSLDRDPRAIAESIFGSYLELANFVIFGQAN